MILKLFSSNIQLGDFEVDSTAGVYTLSQTGEEYLSARFSRVLLEKSTTNCELKNEKKPTLCLEWEDLVRLEVTESTHDDNINCFNIVWKPISNHFIPLDCLKLSDYHWYGMGSLKSQQWPLEENSFDFQAYISSDLTQNEQFGPMIERYWINSNGVGIFVDNSVPLFVSFNNKQDNSLCFKSDYDKGVYTRKNQFPVLKYSICKAKNVRKVHDYLSKKCFDLPTASPDEDIMKFPKWSTYSRFQTNVTQFHVLNLVNSINKNGFSSSQIDIGVGYEREIGDFNFNDKKFPNAHQMIGELKENKFRVTTSVNPIISVKTKNYQIASKEGYLVHNNGAPYNFIFQSKNVSIIDLTNSEAAKWFKTKLKSILTDHLIDSFKFNLGQASFLSTLDKTRTFSEIHNPCEYTTKYVELAQTFDSRVIVQSGYQTQKFPIYIEIPEHIASWSKDNGLPSIIPTVITYGLLGYHFVIPGPIGGISLVNDNNKLKLPNRNLYIRWIQLAAYLPVMEFSVAPWQYDDEVVKIAKEFVLIHETKVLPHLILASKESQVNGSPLIRPVWWIAPQDKTALRIDCEFLVGDNLLVAPILEDVAVRDVYLPEGSLWEDQSSSKRHEGGQWLIEYSANISHIPTFIRLKTPL
ncbi:hypothetical protein LOTGIDRAFT_120394 [Lottia gigantea]|uniref:Glycoside hydrolase family 31 N-terminal domain-containing protein n=1 Tax=Lottia gigantea TaxID=225164 RepID=V4ACN0_LOTGI|nr:hypothetical protein LOTGIDRAFT_120394 [Lottia gigantea]ESO92830.1 hypothetical protein LOTGIDRAFT_120394 [Lottia gigantea]